MKKILLVLVLVAIVTGGVFADFWNEYAPGIDEGNLFINVGIAYGFFPIYTSDTVLPPIEASVEYKLPFDLPITAGGFFAIALGSEENNINHSYWNHGPYSGHGDKVGTYKTSETAISFGAKASWHLNLDIRNLDTYASLTLGWLIWTVKDKKESLEAGHEEDYYRCFSY